MRIACSLQKPDFEIDNIARINTYLPYSNICEIRIVDVSLNTDDDTNKYTSYHIAFNSNIRNLPSKIETSRRYKEFEYLKEIFIQHNPIFADLEFPPKTTFGRRFDPYFVNQRKELLETFLKKYLNSSFLFL